MAVQSLYAGISVSWLRLPFPVRGKGLPIYPTGKGVCKRPIKGPRQWLHYMPQEGNSPVRIDVVLAPGSRAPKPRPNLSPDVSPYDGTDTGNSLFLDRRI